MKNITVYTLPNCQQCNATFRKLDTLGATYTVIHLDQDPDALATFKAKGYIGAPIVVTDTEEWSGYRPEKLNAAAH